MALHHTCLYLQTNYSTDVFLICYHVNTLQVSTTHLPVGTIYSPCMYQVITHTAKLSATLSFKRHICNICKKNILKKTHLTYNNNPHPLKSALSNFCQSMLIFESNKTNTPIPLQDLALILKSLPVLNHGNDDYGNK